MEQRAQRYGWWAMLGGGALIVGATLLDVGRLTGQPLLAAGGNLLMAFAGFASIGLPLGLHTTGVLSRSTLALAGTSTWGLGTALHTLAAILDHGRAELLMHAQREHFAQPPDKGGP